ncbi:alanine:cation symporter family protein, partial [Motilimonas sp. 1_MG-2023]|uniref:alanine:cation symporter family protein n=1 Tax=Motilimonas sp. 1_MG-2023 TaxID=3062672 RepID=UPI0026E33F9C
VVLVMVMYGALAESPLVWSMADVSMVLIALINLVAILMLSNVLVKLAKDYNEQRAQNNQPTFDAIQ